jgi:acetyl esterase/lipase
VIYSAELDQHVEEMRRVNAQLANLPPAPWRTVEDVQRLRVLLASPDSPFAATMGQPVLPVAETTIPGPAGPIPARVIRPDRVEAVYLDIHGGAWMIGSARMDDRENDELARTCGVVTVSIDYRLTPEHTLGDAMDDCEAAALWVIERAQAEFGTDRLLIGGGSAGAHLAAMTLLRLRDRHGAARRFLAANLVFGCFDLSGTPSTRIRGARSFTLGREVFESVLEHVLDRRPLNEIRDPSISPLFAELSGLPPALFTVGLLDPLLDDTLFMSSRWQVAGNEAELALYPESEHGFTGLPTAMARAATSRQQDFVRSRLAAAAAVGQTAQ